MVRSSDSMAGSPDIRKGGALKHLPTGAFFTFVAGVCLALLVSGAYTFGTLTRLEADYLENRARETVSTLDLQARGPGRRNNPEFWRGLLSDSAASSRGSVAFLALIDGSGMVLADAGELGFEAGNAEPGMGTIGKSRIFVYDLALAGARQSAARAQPQIAGWRLRVGMYASETYFIRRQAWLQLAVTAIAITTLLLLSGYLMRALRHYLESQRREISGRHLRALGTMAATLAHEIRNPLGAMKGLTQLAQEQIPAGHESQAMMYTVVAEAQRLERLVTDLLTFARLPKPREEVFELAAFLANLESLARARLSEARVSLETSGSGTVRSDPDLLRQLLINVALNAIEASPAGGKVTLRASRDERKGELLLEVCDSGPGIPAGDPEELFQPFRTHKTNGTGLGLTVSRRIAESLGGFIRLANRPEGGAICTIRIPVGRL